MATCGGFILKLILLLFNLAWLAIGSFVLYLGANIQFSTGDSIDENFNSKLASSALVLFIVGGTLVVIAAVGFLGACFESSNLLKFYGAILVILLVVTCVGIYYGHKYEPELGSRFNLIVNHGIIRFEKSHKLAYTLQKFQTWMQCCGWNGPLDYSRTLSGKYPSSCCKDDSYSFENANKTCTDLAYNIGCKYTVIQSLSTNVITYAIVSLILIQLIVILATCCFASEISQPHNAYL